MKIIFLIVLLVISFSGMAISQTITFDKTLPTNSANQVIQTNDGGYLLNCAGYLNFVKTDQSGYIQWKKEYPWIISPGKKISRTLDGGLIAVGNKLNGLYNDICLAKLDNQLDTIWTKSFGAFDKPEIGHAVIQLPDSSYIISSYESPNFFLRKIDPSGTLVWAKAVGNPSPFPSYLVNLNDGNFLFGKASAIMKMNTNADTLWLRTTASYNQSFLTNDGHILVSSHNNLQKLDLDGNLLWQKTNTFVKSLAESQDGNYILLMGNYTGAPTSSQVIKIDTSGNILTQVPFDYSGEDIIKTLDGGFAICGNNKRSNINNTSYYSWLLKTDNNLNYSAINFINPLDGEKLIILETYSIIWKAKNINFVNIDYSLDNQVSWNKIIHYYPAASDTFNWELPPMSGGNLFIKISDSFNPDIYDRSDPPQNAINYNSLDYIAANEILMMQSNNGMNSHYPAIGAGGFYWPGGEDATISAIFEDGLVWGGKINGEIRVNGSTYRQGLIPGYILPSGLPSDPYASNSKTFKLIKNWQFLPPGSERSRYEFDFLNWPVDLGAPWDDNDGDGVYTFGIDNPRILGEETLFFVANDLDTARSIFTYGSNPIGLELQATTFGYNSDLLKDVVFKKFKIINKSPDTITDMYLTYWTDDDLGNAGDDYIGCDTLLNLGYTYNADNDDESGYGTPPPAVGHLIVQPPIVPAEPSDSARYGDGWKKGFRNIPIYSFLLYIGGHNIFSDPSLGVYSGTLQFYNNMKGLLWDGAPILDPNTNLQTRFCLAGDPVFGTGWYEGPGWPDGYPPSDRRYAISSGPFNMAPNDTQEVAIAFLIKKGTDNINSITELKNYASQIQHWYDNDFVTDVEENTSVIPLEYSLSQNYPNPFNPTTTIKYSIPNVISIPTGRERNLNVTLKVYDILGREIVTLVNEEQSPGSYRVEFKSKVGSFQLASGIYFYQLKAGSFTETKKMILLK